MHLHTCRVYYLTANGRRNGGNVSYILGYKQRFPKEAIKVEGTCCVRIYKRKGYRGDSQKLQKNYIGKSFQFRSLKWGVCNDL